MQLNSAMYINNITVCFNGYTIRHIYWHIYFDCQFFLTLAPDIDYLDNKHTVFGEVAEGFEVLQKINEAFVDKEGRPYQDIRYL